MKFKISFNYLSSVLMATILVVCAPAAPEAAAARCSCRGCTPNLQRCAPITWCLHIKRTPTLRTPTLALRYAAEYFQVNIIAAGPEGWDTQAQAEAIEAAVANQADGIITRMWDDSPSRSREERLWPLAFR